MRFSVLGPVSVQVDGALEPLGAPRQAGLLAALLMLRGQPTSTHVLADLLWDGELVTDAALRVTLGRLRKSVAGSGDDPFTRGRGVIGLDLEDDDVDAWAFERLISRAREFRGLGRARPAVREYEQALRLVRSRPYEDVLTVPALAAESDRLLQLARNAELELVASLLTDDAPLTAAERALDPSVDFGEDVVADEQRICLALIGLGRSGRDGQARQVAGAFAQMLDHEWGVQPGNDLETLLAEFDDWSAGSSSDALAGFGASILERFTPLDAAAGHRVPATEERSPSPGVKRLLAIHRAEPLVGRLEESLRLARHVDRRSAGRVVALTGEPGSGRTRLLAHAASAAVDAGALVVALSLRPGPTAAVDVLRGELDAVGLDVGSEAGVGELGNEAPGAGADVAAARDAHAGRVAAVTRAMAGAGDRLLVLLDDLELAEAASVDLLVEALDRCPEARWIVVAPTESGGAVDAEGFRLSKELERQREVVELELAPLDEAATAALLDQLINEPVTADLVGQVHAASGGLVAHVVEQARYLSSLGEWAGEHVAVDRLVAARIGALTDAERIALLPFALIQGSATSAVATATEQLTRRGSADESDDGAGAVTSDETRRVLERLVELRLLVDGLGPDEYQVASDPVRSSMVEVFRARDLAEVRRELAAIAMDRGDVVEAAWQVVHLDPGHWHDDAQEQPSEAAIALDVDSTVSAALSRLLNRSAYGAAAALGVAYVDSAGVDRDGSSALEARILAATAMVTVGDGRGRALAKLTRNQARVEGTPRLLADVAAAMAPINSGMALPSDDIDELVSLIGRLDDDVLRQVQLGCWTAHQLTVAGRDVEAVAVITEAEERAALANSARLRGLAAGIRYQACTGVALAPAAADAAMADLTSLVELSGDPSTRAIWGLSSVSAALRDGDLADIDEALARLAGAIEASPRPDLPWIKASAEAARSLLRGDLNDAEHHVLSATEIGAARAIEIAPGIASLQRGLISAERGELGALRQLFPTTAAANGPALLGASLRALADTEAGADLDADLVLHEVLEVERALEVAGQLWPAVAALCGQAAFEVRNAAAGRFLLDGLTRHRGRGLGLYTFAAFGSTDRVIGFGAAACGDFDLAVNAFESASETERRRGLVTWADRSCIALGSVLLRRGRDGDAERAERLWAREPITPAGAAFLARERARI